MQCTTAYPTSPDQWGLNIINDMLNRYKDVKIGFSDHSGDIYACLAAAACGAEVFEFHVALNHKFIFKLFLINNLGSSFRLFENDDVHNQFINS